MNSAISNQSRSRTCRRALTSVLALVMLLSGVAGAQMPDPEKVDSSDAYLLHLPGIAGEAGIDRLLISGLKEGGFKGKSEIYDWTSDKQGIAALIDRKHTDEQAAKIAEKVAAHRKAHPKGQIMLTGHSGGTGLIVFALEKLPKDVMVDGVLLLSPALSPEYDLSPALSHVKGRMYVFSSTFDYFVLGLGTKLFGTIDRKRGESAGRVGFVQPKDAAYPKQYEKLVSCPYDKGWLKYGNIGDHMSVMSRAFSRHVLTPLVLSHLPGGGSPMTRPTR